MLPFHLPSAGRFDSAMLDQIQRRRTFAIISHPDAGKTTLTEKLLLYGGALQLAGSVTARKNQRATTSDWMELEKERGISVSSTVLQFEYSDHCLNLLDTPGHRDFSEDTYRVLTAVDAAVMVIDAGKGIESQTLKLFEVCRKRGVPIITFMNKLDRPARDPFALLDELERVLGIHAIPVNWPVGTGPDFRGVIDRRKRSLHLFERTPKGAYRAPVAVRDVHDAQLKSELTGELHQQLVDELELLDGAGAEYDRDAIGQGLLTPVFFGSAVNNFGIQLLLEALIEFAPSPIGRPAIDGTGSRRFVEPMEPNFSGFIFKIQANMDPRHRDRLAFVRICSGRFERDMVVTHTRTGEQVRLSSSHRIFGRDRETVDEGYPGDIVGILGRTGFRIGDTLATDANLNFETIRAFAPECFAWLHNPTTAQHKRFSKGLEQLLQEGVVHSFLVDGMQQRVALLGAVGPLQFDVVQYRMQSEYGAESRLERAPWTVLRWIESGTFDPIALATGTAMASDSEGRKVLLFHDQWSMEYFANRNTGVKLSSFPPATAGT